MKINQTKEQCVHDICRFPLLLKELQHVSPIQLVKKIGYADFCEQISIKDIIDELKKDDSFITDWISYSDDKRYSPAWAISKEHNNYILSYGIEIKQNSKDPYEPCATMVRMEMEGLINNRFYLKLK